MDSDASPPLTLAVGPESLLAERAVTRVVEETRTDHPDVEVRSIDAKQSGAGGLVAEACSPTLFDVGAVVVVESVDWGDESLVSAVADAVGTTSGPRVIACHPGGTRGKRVLKALLSLPHRKIDCAEIKRGRPMNEFVTAEFRQQGKVAAADAVALLVAVCGHDVREIASACAQLSADVPDRVVSAAEVRKYMGSVADVTAFDIADAVLFRKPAYALRLVRAAESGDSGRVGPATIAAIARGFRQVIRYQTLAAGMSERDAAAAVGVPVWRLGPLVRQARLWRPDAAATAFLVLEAADAEMKGGMRAGEQLDTHQKRLALERAVVRLADDAVAQA